MEVSTLLRSTHLIAFHDRQRCLIKRIVRRKVPVPLSVHPKRVSMKMKRCVRFNQSDEVIVPYADDPLADSAWTAEYEKEMKENEELEKELKHRLEGRVEVDVWYVSVFLFVISLSITLVFAINSFSLPLEEWRSIEFTLSKQSRKRN